MDYVALGKEISYALRHAPWEYELELDQDGWVETEQLLLALREGGKWPGLAVEHFHEMIRRSDKQRHEIADGRIRALYGHSVPQRIAKMPAEPPDELYHGTARRFLPAIRASGLLPQGRQYVHLSTDREMALQVGRRRDGKPALLMVRAAAAHRDGVAFYRGNDRVWLADAVPAGYLEEERVE